MIKTLTIKNLFGQFNYCIEFKPQGITIITGPNGYGKSTILQIIEAVVEKDLYELYQFPFEKLIIDNILTLEKRKSAFIVNDVTLDVFPKRMMDNWERRHGLPFIERIGPDAYLDLREEKVLTYNEVKALREQFDENEVRDRLISANYGKALHAKKEAAKFKELDKQLLEIKKHFGKIKFIKEQRLLRQEYIEDERYYADKRPTAVEVIGEIPQKVQEQIKNVILTYSETSSQLDSTFPKRLFEAKSVLTQTEYLEELGEIILKQEKIQTYNLIRDVRTVSASYSEENAKALKVYLDDTKIKLSVFDELINKLETFVQVINSKLSYKKIVVSSEFGLKVQRADGTELNLNKLSSGEQQIIVLYYELIFEVNDKVMLLIDEPEISLHVAWQRELMNDFNKIINLKSDGLSVVVATHSPQVINNNWNLIIDLGEQDGIQ